MYLSKRKLKPKEHEEMGELNIIPYLDILMNLVIFMLLSMTGLATFGVLNVTAPSMSAGGGGGPAEQALNLTVAISDKGFFVAATGAVLPGVQASADEAKTGAPTIASKPGTDGPVYDYKVLNEMMKKVKTSFPAETKIIIAADPATKYDVLTQTMDACRETGEKRELMFPDVTLGAF